MRRAVGVGLKFSSWSGSSGAGMSSARLTAYVHFSCNGCTDRDTDPWIPSVNRLRKLGHRPGENQWLDDLDHQLFLPRQRD